MNIWVKIFFTQLILLMILCGSGAANVGTVGWRARDRKLNIAAGFVLATTILHAFYHLWFTL
jgi:hypothetical protein